MLFFLVHPTLLIYFKGRVFIYQVPRLSVLCW